MLGDASPCVICGSEWLAPEAPTMFVLDSFPRMFVCDQPCDTELESSSPAKLRHPQYPVWKRQYPLPGEGHTCPYWTLSQGSSRGPPPIAKWKSLLSRLMGVGVWGWSELPVAVKVESDKPSSSPWAHMVCAGWHVSSQTGKGSDPSHVLTEGWICTAFL